MPKEKTNCPSLNEEPATKIVCGVTYNAYDRHTLYNEVWSAPMTQVAEKYHISNTGLKKICVSMRIPTPSAGYWAQKKAGKSVIQMPLENPEKNFTKYGERPTYTVKQTEDGETVKVRSNKTDLQSACMQKIHRENMERIAAYNERYDNELNHLREAVKNAELYETACKLRRYAEALQRTGKSEDADWVFAKADLFDPTVAFSDLVFGTTIPVLSTK